MNKRYLKILFLFIVVATAGFFTQKICYRTATVEEVEKYHQEQFYNQPLISVEEVPNNTDIEGTMYLVKYSEMGQKEFKYRIVAPRRWCLPFASYKFVQD